MASVLMDDADITVYDLAEKMAKGQPLTDAAHREVAAELLALKTKYDELEDALECLKEKLNAVRAHLNRD